MFDNQEKRAIVRRAIVGALASGVRDFRYMADTHGITAAAADEFAGEANFVPVESSRTASTLDTVHAAEALQAADCGAVITLGGDGTNRAFALGWRDAPLVPVSTGTNNVFPTMVEATVAGAAAGLVATGQVPLEDVAAQVKAVHIEIEGERDDLALVDAVLAMDRFVGSRAIWGGERLREAILTRAEPSAVGITSIGGLLAPLTPDEDEALHLTLGPGEGGVSVLAPIAPGLYEPIAVRAHKRIALGEAVSLTGAGVLAFDGERERVLKPGQAATLRVARDGPWVVDVHAALTRAAREGLYRNDEPSSGSPREHQHEQDGG